MLQDYLRIARPDHWIKNIFILPGVVFAYFLTSVPFEFSMGVNLFLGMLATCLTASANYVINEWLDAEFDRYHPTKKLRPAVGGGLKGGFVFIEYMLLAVGGLALSLAISLNFALTEGLLLVMGIIYNVKPLRSKDIPYLDVLSESFNNVIRLLLGWFIVTSQWLPPISIVIGYWMGGAFLMAIKRYAEFRMIGDPQLAGLYRRSFKYYTEQSLLTSAIFYALCSVFFSGIFLIKYRLELLIAMPFLCGLFCLYFGISFKADSAVQKPEKLYKEKFLMLYTGFIVVLVTILMFVDIPGLKFLLSKTLLKSI